VSRAKSTAVKISSKKRREKQVTGKKGRKGGGREGGSFLKKA